MTSTPLGCRTTGEVEKLVERNRPPARRRGYVRGHSVLALAVTVVLAVGAWSGVAAARSGTWEHPMAAHWAALHRGDIRAVRRDLTTLESDLDLCTTRSPRSSCHRVTAGSYNPGTWQGEPTTAIAAVQAALTLAHADGLIPAPVAERWWRASLQDMARGCAAALDAIRAYHAGLAAIRNGTATPATGVTLAGEPTQATAEVVAATELMLRVEKYLFAKQQG